MFSAGALSIAILFVLLGFFFSRNVQTSSDYSVAGRKASATAVSGIIMGALVGGASTVGTVQMAYEFGLSAWWFTLGAGIGCLFLGIWFAKPLRNSDLITIPEFLKNQYGYYTSLVSMLASSLGTFLSVVAQYLAGVALLRSVFPISSIHATLLLAFLVLAFIFLGGLKSYSQLGKAKIMLLYLALLLCSIKVLSFGNSPLDIIRSLPVQPYLNPFGRGLSKDAGALISMIVGVFCTQIYIQGVFAASSAETAQKGVLIAAFTTPPLGLMGVFIGLYLRRAGIILEPSHALPLFIFRSFPPFLAGILWGGILVTVIGTAAGLSLGIATNMMRDVILPLGGNRFREDSSNFMDLSRISVALIVFLSAYAGSFLDGTMILHWSYLSMGLRGVGTFFPFILAILFPGSLSSPMALLSISCGLVSLLLVPLLELPVSPLVIGISVSGIIAVAGSRLQKYEADL